jgi:hypothetical protein
VTTGNGTQSSKIDARSAAAVLLLMLVSAAVLHGMGQPWWCAQGDLTPWSFAVNSPHNSQHLFDPYTLTHVLHGIAFYALLWALAGGRLSLRQRFLLAMAVEAAWEIFENTDFVIQRYREATISLDYFGDSIINSLGDILACAAGYLMAAGLPLWGSIATFAGVEILLLVWIRDSLLLNILMLLWPIEAIKAWQSG